MVINPFFRLLLSHLAILVLSSTAGLYSIAELGSLSGKARKALDNNHRMIGYQEALTDAFLSQVRYGGKYLITHAEGRHEQFHQFKKDFIHYVALLKVLGQTESIQASLVKLERLHRQYHDLFEREVQYIRGRQNYAQSRYEQERDKLVESSISELDRLKLQLRADLHEKLEGIDQGARTARKIAIVTTLILLFVGGLISLKVSRTLGTVQAEVQSKTPPRAGAFQSVLARYGFAQGMRQSLKAWLARAVRQSRAFSRLQSRRLTVRTLTLTNAWSRRSTIWKNLNTPKGN